MPDWLYRLHNSRRARNLTLGTLALLTAGSCGGAVLGSYVVEGARIAEYRGRSVPMASNFPAQPAPWVEQAAVEVSGAGFSPDGGEGYSDTLH